jgi:MYXO-CTERM domain-containing protein
MAIPVDERTLQGGGCACTLAAGDTGGASSWTAVMLVIGLGIWRRRRTAAARAAA